MARNPTLTGNKVILAVRGKVVGRGAGIDIGETFGPEPIHEIGMMGVHEIIPTRYDVTVNLRSVAIRSESLEAQGLVPTIDNVDSFPPIEVVVIDKATGDLIATIEGCIVASKGLSFAANAVIGRNVSWAARKVTYADAA